MLDDLNLGHLANNEPPGPLHGGFDMSVAPGWPLDANMASQSQGFNRNTGTIPMNQGFTPSNSSHMATQQHQWDTSAPFSPSNPSQYNFVEPPTEYTNPISSADPLQGVQSSSAAGTGQSNVSPSGTRVAGGGHGAPTQLPAAHRTSIGIQSQANFHPLPFFGQPAFSQNRLQANRNPRGIPSEPLVNGIRPSPTNNQTVQMWNSAPVNVPLANSGLPIPASTQSGLNPGQEARTVGMPDWITFVGSSPLAGKDVIRHRRDVQFALDIILEHLPRQPPAGYNGIKVPATASVKNCADTTGKTLLVFRIYLSGATTKRRYDVVCENCQKREGERKGTPSLIDFKAKSDMIQPKDGKICVRFLFCCHPEHHGSGDTEYLLDVVLSEDEGQKHVVAQCQLPFSVNIVSRHPVRRRMDDANGPAQIYPPGNKRIHHPARSPANRPDSPVSVLPASQYPSAGLLCNFGSFGGGRLDYGLGYTPSISQMSHFPIPTAGPEQWNTDCPFTMNHTSLDHFEPFPLFTEDTNPAMPTSIIQQKQLSGVMDEGNFNMPDWIVFIKPLPQARQRVLTFRRETHVALDIFPDQLPNQPPAGYSGIKIPSTRSVKNCADSTGKTLLELRIHVYGATSKKRYETGCENCEKREKKSKGALGLLDFHAQRNIIEPKDGKIRVDFSFCCHPKCHKLGDTEYLLDVILSEDVGQERVVAHHELPFSFNVLARIREPKSSLGGGRLSPMGVKRKMRRTEQSDGIPPGVNRSDVRPRSVDPPQRDPPSNELINHRVINPPRTDGECDPTLTEVNPGSGSITGGARIWFKGVDFPTHFALYARFGTTVVSTTFSNPYLLTCTLPPATTPGVVDITLSKFPQPSAPEYGTSLAKFQYLGDQDQLIPILLRIQGSGYPEFSPVLQALLTALNGPHPNRGLQGGSHARPRQDSIEAGLVEALTCLQARPDFHVIVSTTNDYNQTLAHLSIRYGYSSLLSHLVDWGIDLTIADTNGLTALQFANQEDDLDSIRILRRDGAFETMTDTLGRTPSKPQSEESDDFDSDIDLDAEYDIDLDTKVAVGSSSGVYPPENDIDEQLALGEQFSTLDLDSDKDSGHGPSDFDDYASDDNEDPDNMAINTFGDVEDDSGGGASGNPGDQFASSSTKSPISMVNRLLVQKNRRRKRSQGPRMLPDTPYNAAISSVSKGLRELEAEPEAIDFLTSGLFPDGTISLTSLMTEMTPEEVAKFQVSRGTLKYHGLLRRDKEIIYCRLCPEVDQLDFRDPEEALHHIAKNHFEMGYSCDCECNKTYWTSADWRRHRMREGLGQTRQ